MLKHLGGRVLVQDAASAAHFGMPSAAIATGCVDFILRLDAMARTLIALVMAPAAAALFQVGTAFSQTHKYNALAKRWRH
jgi:two-component system chemotaxis response regulator CheB